MTERMRCGTFELRRLRWGFDAITDRNCNGTQVHPPDAGKSITDTEYAAGKGFSREAAK